MARASLRRIIKGSTFRDEVRVKANYLPVRSVDKQKEFIKSLKEGKVFETDYFDYNSSDF